MPSTHSRPVDLSAHRRELLARQRCGACAEPVPSVAILRAEACPTCGEDLTNTDAQAALDALRRTWRKRRLLTYFLIGLLSFFGGTVPMLQSVILVLSLVYVHLKVLRHSLDWLGRSRRVAARFSMKILAAGISCFNLVVNVLVIPLVGVSGGILAILAIIQAIFYVEISLWMIDRRLGWEKAGEPLKVREWLLPVSLIGGTLLIVGTGLGASTGVLYMLAMADIPTVSEIARFLLDLSAE